VSPLAIDARRCVTLSAIDFLPAMFIALVTGFDVAAFQAVPRNGYS
jgi:hypothetical protein